MRKTELYFGVGILVVGVLLLIGALFKIDVGALLCPSVLILIGVWLIFRMQTAPDKTDLHFHFTWDLKRRHAWQVAGDQEHWSFVNDTDLDLSQADLAEGENSLRLGAFVNDLKIWVPPDVGLAIESMAFMTEVRIFGEHQQTFIAPYTWQSDNFATATRKLILRPVCFVATIRVKSSELEE